MRNRKGVNVVGVVWAVWSALRVVFKSLNQNSAGGGKITKDEAAQIMEAVVNAADDYLQKHVL